MFELPNDYYYKIPAQSIHCYLSNIRLNSDAETIKSKLYDCLFNYRFKYYARIFEVLFICSVKTGKLFFK
jgi:hypothetical protein